MTGVLMGRGKCYVKTETQGEHHVTRGVEVERCSCEPRDGKD